MNLKLVTTLLFASVVLIAGKCGGGDKEETPSEPAAEENSSMDSMNSESGSTEEWNAEDPLSNDEPAPSMDEPAPSMDEPMPEEGMSDEGISDEGMPVEEESSEEDM